MPATPSLPAELYGLLCSGSALLSHPHLGDGDEHCQPVREPFSGLLPSCGWVTGISTHLDGGEGSRGGNMEASDNKQGW